MRETGTRASRLLNIDQSSSAALSLDLACSNRLLMFDNEKERLRFKATKALMKIAMMEAINEAIFGGQAPLDDDDDEPDNVPLADDDIL
jgi:hypothetical protein